MRIENQILNNLIYNEEFTRKSLPFIKIEYFKESQHRIIFNLVDDFIKKYNKMPSKESLLIDLENKNSLNEEDYKKTKEFVEVSSKVEVEFQWLLDKTEKFCQDQAIMLALRESIKIVDDKNSEIKGSIPKILSDALAVSFDSSVGHDFLLDAESRFDFYHKREKRVPFSHLKYMNLITGGGTPAKTINVILGGTNVGKSLIMCDFAADNLANGFNVLYITLELSEERVAERIDANLLNIPLDEMMSIPKDVYQKKMGKLQEKTKGRLFVKEYPTAQAGTSHFRHLLNELKIKKGFIPDIIYIDYLNICLSSRIKMSANANSYTYMKAVAEELRGLAVEFQIPIWTATQVTRGGFGDSDIELTDISESFGVAATADFVLACISSEELQEQNLYLFKQLKSRYGDPSKFRKFMVGVDKAKMRLYDVEKEVETKPQETVQDINKKFFSGPNTSKFKEFK
jgi:replicative DNA helicase